MGVLKKLLSYDTVFTEELLERIREQYVPTNWVSGEIITATRLNHMEQGIYENSKMAENTVQQDGEYPFLTAGLAENLESDTFTVNQTPYFKRPVINNSDREIDSVVGGSVGWNQLLNPANYATSQTIEGITFTNNEDGSITLSGTATDRAVFPLNNINLIGSNVYFVSPTNISGVWIGNSSWGAILGNIVKPEVSGGVGFNVMVASGTVIETSETVYPILINITQLLGSAIANYIYTLETNEAGAGIAKLKSWGFFAEDYYEYDAGSIESVEGVFAHVTRDADENIIGNYPLDSSLTLRGIPKLDSGNNLYYDGDVYSSDGTVTKRYGVVNLGDLTWNYATSAAYTVLFVSEVLSNIKTPSVSDRPNIISAKAYPVKSWNDLNAGASASNGICVFTDGSIRIVDSAYTDAETFKTAMSGVMLVYELATATTETADSFQNPQLVTAGGTEEYVSTGLVPVGHYTQYPENLKAKLEAMPNLPTQEGVYVLKYENGTATYILLETDETVVDMLARIAALEGE